MAWRNRWLATALAGMLLAGLGAALALALRSPEPAAVPSIELETDDRGRVRPAGQEPRDRSDAVPPAPDEMERRDGDDDGDDRPGEAPYDGSEDLDDGPGDVDDAPAAPSDDSPGGGDEADGGDDGEDADD